MRHRRADRRHRAIRAVVFALLLDSTVAVAQGGPPLETDDPWTPGDGRFEVVLGAEIERLSTKIDVVRPILDLNYGLGDYIQLKLELPWALAFSDEHTLGGPGNVDLGLKWRFIGKDEETDLGLSVYPQLSFDVS